MCVFVHVAVLDDSLREHLFGQHIAHSVILGALKAHFREDARPKKALALSLHGLSGTGKTYTSQFIINSLFKKGPKSKYAHFFTGRNHFSMESKTDIYKVNICASLQ
jgi:Cdc6-like AAA superfamily ATPase